MLEIPRPKLAIAAIIAALSGRRAVSVLAAGIMICLLTGLTPPATASTGAVRMDVASAGPKGPADGPELVRETPVPPPEGIGPEILLDRSITPRTLRTEPEVGDSLILWLFFHVGMPHFEQALCVVRGKTDHAYVVVQESEWNVRFDQADVDQILERWENSSIGLQPDKGIYELNSQHFGDPPDMLDNDPRIYICFFDFGNSSDGFFFWFDQEPDGANPPYRSNEREIVYLNTSNGQDPGGDYMISVLAHEFEHMIHWFYDENEDSWVDEGMAELAMWFYGRPDVISGFNTNPDNNLIVWEGSWADYIQTYLWSLYFYERYGGAPAVFDLVHEPLNSIQGYERVLDDYGYAADFQDVFADWVVANFLDDPSLADGRFGYIGDELPAFNVMGTYSTYPVPDQARTVNHWAADYYRFRELGPDGKLLLEFDGSDNSRYAIWGLGIHADGQIDILRMEVDDATKTGALVMTGLTEPGDEAILVVADIQSYGSTSYVFGADTQIPTGVADSSPVRIGWSLAAAPNPSSGSLDLRLSGPRSREEAGIEIFDVRGRLVRLLTPAPLASHLPGDGSSGAVWSARWDGRDEAGNRAPAGVYYARSAGETGRAEARLVRID